MHISPGSPGAAAWPGLAERLELQPDAGQRHAAGAVLASAARRREGAGGRGLRHAPAFVEMAARKFEEAVFDLGWQWSTAGAAEFQRFQVKRRHLRVVDHGGEHGRHPGKDGDPLGRQFVHHRVQVEARVQHQQCAQAHAEQQVHRQRIDMEQRQHDEHALLAFGQDRRVAACRLHVLRARRRKVGMGEHRALGQAGGAAGVLQNHVDLPQVGNGMGLVRAVVGKQLLEGHVQIVHRHLAQLPGAFELRAHRRRADRIFAQAADHHLLQPRAAQQAPHLRVQRRQVERDEDVGLTVFDLVLEHALGIER